MTDFDSKHSFPAWADVELSERLAALAEMGENQEVEFKEQLPNQSRDFAKEIAAFASSNSGSIFVGIDDLGNIIGLPDCLQNESRSAMRHRIEGICSSGIKPPVLPSCRWAFVGGKVILVVQVPKGTEPIYYVGGVPYIRHLTAARPAEPQEVIERVLSWHQGKKKDEQSPESQYATELISLLVEIIVSTERLSEVEVNPWLDNLRYTIGQLAERTHRMAADPPPEFADISPGLEMMAGYLEVTSHEYITMGDGWEEMHAAAENAKRAALEIRHKWISPLKIDDDALKGLRSTVATTGRQLSSLANRLDQMMEHHRLNDIQQEAGRLGLIFLRAAAFGLGLGDDSRVANLRMIGSDLQQIEMTTIYMDGGQTERNILSKVRELSRRYDEWAQGLQLQ